MARKFETVFYIAGNGEFSGSSGRISTITSFKNLEIDNVNNGVNNTSGHHQSLEALQDNQGPPVTIIGTTLVTIPFSNPPLLSYIDPSGLVSKFHPFPDDSTPVFFFVKQVLTFLEWSKIRDDAPPGTADGFSGNSKTLHNLAYKLEVAFLRSAIAQTRESRPNDRIIIMTHHAPTIRGSNQPQREYKGGPTSSFNFSGYQNDLLGGEGMEGLREGDVWVFGHTHYSCDFMQDGVRVVANQRGGRRNDSKLANTKYDKDGKVIVLLASPAPGI